MFISFFVRILGIKVVEVYNAQGQFVGKMAVADIESVFSWWIFLGIFLPGLAVIGHI